MITNTNMYQSACMHIACRSLIPEKFHILYCGWSVSAKIYPTSCDRLLHVKYMNAVFDCSIFQVSKNELPSALRMQREKQLNEKRYRVILNEIPLKKYEDQTTNYRTDIERSPRR